MPAPLPPPSLRELVSVFARIGCLGFGGPAGQIALMHREIVDDRNWIDEPTFLSGLNFCHLLPGPEAQQLAAWIGWRLHGWRGGLITGLLFILPGAGVMLALSALYALAADLSWLQALFLGVKAAVLALVLQAVLRIAGRTLKTPVLQGLAAAAFLAIFLLDLPFPAVVLAAGTAGGLLARFRPDWLALAPAPPPPDPMPGAFERSLLRLGAWGLAWAAPLVMVTLVLGPDHVLWKIGVFFSQLAVVTFGGAYAVLAYMAQAAVESQGWLSAREMTDGLGLAETTPGPLILVTQFVGFLAAFRAPEPFSPLAAGVLGAALTTWVTFTPSFLWIFTFAPWIERLQASRLLRGSLAALTAAVAGVVASISLWFAMHVLFGRMTTLDLGLFRLDTPVAGSLDLRAAGISAMALILVFGLRWGVLRVLAACAAAGLLVSGATLP